MEPIQPLNPNDPVGLETLEALAQADRFNEWMFQTILPHCQGHILEIGSGIGNISNFFLEAGREITLTDLREEYLQMLRNKFVDKSNLKGVEKIDLVHPNFDQEYAAHLGKYGTVYALNVVEHIEDDALALQNCHKLLQKDGMLIILVPAYQMLFNQFDVELGHFRRYTRNSLTKLFKDQNFEIVHRQYFNLAATFGWFWYGKVLGRKIIPEGPVKTYNKLVPVFKLIDKVVFNQIGNSVIIAGKKIEK